MKREYPRYGSKTAGLEKQLSVVDAGVLDQFLAFCSMTAGPKTLYKNRRNLLHFRDVLEKPFNQITREDVIAFWGLVRLSPYSTPTKISVLKTVRRFLKWFKRDTALIEGLKIERHKYNEEKLNSAALFPQDELLRLISVAERVKDKVLVSIIRDSSTRPDEVRHARWKNVMLDRRAIWLYSLKTTRGRLLPLRSQTIAFLKEWQVAWPFPERTADDFVFPAGSPGKEQREKALSVEAINKIIKRLARKAGISRDVWTYLVRHTQLTHAWKQGIQGPEHDYYAGHVLGSDQKEVYIHLSQDEMVENIRNRLFGENESDDDLSKSTYEERIERLEQQLKQVLQHLQESDEAMTEAVGQFPSPVAKQLKD